MTFTSKTDHKEGATSDWNRLKSPGFFNNSDAGKEYLSMN